MTTVAVCIPTIERRAKLLDRALTSVYAQEFDTINAVDITAFVQTDRDREGAWATRNQATRRALAADVDWVAFLDDDDELLPHHVDHLLGVAHDHHADMVWGWFQIKYPTRQNPEVDGVGDPFAHLPGDDTNGGTGYRGRQYDPAQPHIVPITYMVRADVLAEAMDITGGFQADTIGSWDMQDQPLIDAIHAVSARGSYADMRTTWLWHHHGGNTSGLPDR